MSRIERIKRYAEQIATRKVLDELPTILAEQIIEECSFLAADIDNAMSSLDDVAVALKYLGDNDDKH